MEELIKLLASMQDGTPVPPEFKASIKDLFQKMSVEAGKAKTDLESYKKGDSEYKKLTKKLKDAGIEEDRYDSIAEELGVKKTLQDEVAIYKATGAETLKALKEAQGQVARMQMENVLGRKIDEVAKSYKTPDGKTVKISDRFIDKTELYKKLDLESEVLVQDRISKVMAAAYENQSAFMKEVGLDGHPVHQVQIGESNFGSGKVLDVSSVKAVMAQSKGSLDGAAQALTLYENAAKPTGT